MLNRQPVVITSVNPLEGHEGTIVTFKGSGFAPHLRNNCVVMGGMGACARVQPNSSATELKVRIGPVAKVKEGEILMWPGIGLDLYTEELTHGETNLRFSETAIFRNGAPVSSSGASFKLTKASPNTFGGYFERLPASRVDLGGFENGPAMRVRFPKDFSLPHKPLVDVCVVLKEPTLAVDFVADIATKANGQEDCLHGVAKSIAVAAGLVGEKVFAGVARNQSTGELELYVTKPYLQNGMMTIHFGSRA